MSTKVSKQVKREFTKEPCRSKPNSLACTNRLKRALRNAKPYKSQSKIRQSQNINIRIGELGAARQALAQSRMPVQRRV